MKISDFANKHRVHHPLGLGMGGEKHGCFIIPRKDHKLKVIASDGAGWDHVSVSRHGNKVIPTWPDMCFIKDHFFEEEDVVVQFHPKKSEYVNFSKNCLHLWRSLEKDQPTPDRILVGPS